MNAACRMLQIVHAGLVPYAQGLELQRGLAEARLDGSLAHDVLLLLEHPPVITFGRNSKDAHLVASAEALKQRGIEVFEVERGGDVTFHGPGQLVGYPIFDLRRHRTDLHWYLRTLEQALIVALAELGIPAERRAGYTGVWTRGRKIASIGVHAKQWVTWHGFALNVTTDLSYFDLIVPCGIPGVAMTSVQREAARSAAGGNEKQPALRREAPQGETQELAAATRAAVANGFRQAFGFGEIVDGAVADLSPHAVARRNR